MKTKTFKNRNKNYYKNCDVEITESSRRTGGYFNYTTCNYSKCYVASEDRIDYIFSSTMNFIASKRQSGKHYTCDYHREITPQTWDRSVSKFSKLEKANEIQNLKSKTKSAVRFLLIADVRESLKSQAIGEAKVVALAKKEDLTALKSQLSKAKESGTKQRWHELANQMVSLVGYEFRSILEWKEVFSIAKSA